MRPHAGTGRTKVLRYINLKTVQDPRLAESVQAEPAAAAAPVPHAPTSVGARAARRMLAAFTYRDFRVQWFGACTSSIGTWMQIVAQNWLVLSLTGSAFFLGLDAFLQQLPIILFTLIGGVLADRLDRRRTLLTSQYIQMATVGHARRADVLPRRPDLAHPRAVVHRRASRSPSAARRTSRSSRRSSTRRICRTPSRSTRSSSTWRA